MKNIFLSGRRCARLAFGVVGFFGFHYFGHARAATINANSPSFADVTTAIASATDGDTVVVPAGTGTDWTTPLTLTKGITLIGQTTTNPVAKTANDLTIILDNGVRDIGGNAPLIILDPGVGKTCRLSGFTFRTGGVTSICYGGLVKFYGTQTSQIRVDHCHFDSLLYQNNNIAISHAVYGVIDSNVFDFTVNHQSIYFAMGNWGNNSDGNGDGSWTDPPYYGSEKFMFVEDNCINNQSGAYLGGQTDGSFGCRYVFRHNHCYNVVVENHGTEGGRYRGSRAIESYNNDFHWDISQSQNAGGIRSGGLISHDNTYDGVQPTGGFNLEDYRSFFSFIGGGGPFYGASGDNAWDYNDTEGNGTHVDGHPPYLYESGAATSGSTTTLIDTSKNWTPNQWIGFTAKKVSDNQVALILSNTSNALTLYYRDVGGGGAIWTAGDQYQIHQVLVIMDQPCRGQGDLISGANPTAFWSHQALEPCYEWNDIYTPNGTHLHITPGIGPPNLLQEGRDFFNDTPMPGYTPYTYPHPLVSGGGPQAPGDLHIMP